MGPGAPLTTSPVRHSDACTTAKMTADLGTGLESRVQGSVLWAGATIEVSGHEEPISCWCSTCSQASR